MTQMQKGDLRRQNMLEGNLLKVIPVIALPQVITMLIDSLYNLADTYFVSQLGSAATAAVGVNDSLMQLIRAISLAFGMGASSYISRLLGAGDDEEASRAASTTLFTAMGFVALIAALSLCFLSPLINFLGATESSKNYTMSYALWTLLFSPFTAATVCFSQTLRSEGSTTYAMIGSVSGCILNVILDPLFITTFGLEVAGAAIATGISKVVSCYVLFYPYIKRKSILDIRLHYFSPRASLYSEIARMGIPTGLRSSMMTFSTIVINNVAGGFGDIALAAVSVANKCMKVVASAIMGFGQGFQPIAGFCWGGRKYERVKKAFLYTSAIGICLGALLGIVLGLFAEETITLFTAESSMIDIGVTLIRTQCVVLPLHVWVLIASGLFQATGKPLQAGGLGLSRQVFALIPCVIILPRVFGLIGLAHAQAVSDIVSFLIALMLVLPMMREINQLIKTTDTDSAIAEGVSYEEHP